MSNGGMKEIRRHPKRGGMGVKESPRSIYLNLQPPSVNSDTYLNIHSKITLQRGLSLFMEGGKDLEKLDAA